MRTQLIEKEDKRIVWLDFVKFIAIFMMIAVHCTDNVTPAERSEPWYNLWGSFYGSFMRPAIPLFLGPCYMLVESLPLHTMVKMIVCTILLLSVTWGFVYIVRKSGKLGKWIMG